MKQLGMGSGFEKFSKTTRREQFLAEMERIVPWSELCAVVEPHYPTGEGGRPPRELEQMLRIYLLQQWFNLSDPGVEEALYDSRCMQAFARIDLAEQPVPDEVKGYVDLQTFVRSRAQAAGIDVDKPFPFQLAGAPAEVKWHINVDLTEGHPVTRELFAKSKANYVLRNEPMDIVGFYSENHPGVFISAYAPAIPAGGSARNAMHIHMVSKDGKSAGHIDNLTLAPGMVLRLPRR